MIGKRLSVTGRYICWSALCRSADEYKELKRDMDCVSVSLFVCLCVCVCVSLCLSVYPSVYLCVCISVCLYVCRSTGEYNGAGAWASSVHIGAEWNVVWPQVSATSSRTGRQPAANSSSDNSSSRSSSCQDHWQAGSYAPRRLRRSVKSHIAVLLSSHCMNIHCFQSPVVVNICSWWWWKTYFITNVSRKYCIHLYIFRGNIEENVTELRLSISRCSIKNLEQSAVRNDVFKVPANI